MADWQKVKGPVFVVKIVELIVAIVCIALSQDSGLGVGDNVHKIAVVFMVYCGYILIPLMDISRMVSGEKTGKYLALFWSAVGAVLWITAGAIVIEHYRAQHAIFSNLPLIPSLYKPSLNKLIASGILALLNALVYFAEAAFTFKFG